MNRRRGGWRRAVLLWSLPALLLSVSLIPLGSGSAPPAVQPAGTNASFAARAGYSAGLLDGLSSATPATGMVSVVVTFNPTQPGLFDVPAPGARPLTAAQIGDRFGLSPANYLTAAQYFEGQGLTIQHNGPDRLSLTVEGGAAAVDRAFATSLLVGVSAGRSVEVPAVPPSLPSFLQSEVAGVTGLSSGFDQYTLPLRPVSPHLAATAPLAQTDLITPAIARQIYSASNLYNYSGSSHFATGEHIVLLLWGDGYSPSDLATFFSTYYPTGLFPSVTIHPFPIDGAPQPSAGAVNDPSGAPEELTLDLEWSGSLAPGATLDAVYAPDGAANNNYSPTDSSMADALHEAVTGISGVDAISMSFGTAENTAAGLQSAWTTDLAEAAQEQITLLAATGDTGGDSSLSSGCSGTAQPEYPASDPAVIAVGGTNPALARNVVGQVTGIASESAWAGSGGGYSQTYADPSWQLVGSAAGPIGAQGFRGMPDLSASAADNFVFFHSQQQTGAGTSFATPLWAGLVAEMDAQHGSPLGFLTPRLYYIGASEPNGTEANGLADVVGGSNCLGPATRGWDTATGWGSPRALNLYADLTSTFVNLSILANPSPVGPGGMLTVGAHLSNASTGAPISGVVVQVTLTADTSFGPCDGTFGTSSPTTNATGDVAVQISVPACYLGSRAIAAVSVMSGGLFGSNETDVGVNLLGFLGFLGPVATYPTNVVFYVVLMTAAVAVGYVLGRGPPRRHRGAPAPPVDAGTEPPPPESPPTPIAPENSWVVRPDGPTVPTSPSAPTPEPPWAPDPP